MAPASVHSEEPKLLPSDAEGRDVFRVRDRCTGRVANSSSLDLRNRQHWVQTIAVSAAREESASGTPSGAPTGEVPEAAPGAGAASDTGKPAVAEARLDEEFGKGFRKGAAKAEQDLRQRLAKDLGVDDIEKFIAEQKTRETEKEQSTQATSAELTKLQREAARLAKENETLTAAKAERDLEVMRYRKTAPIREAVLKQSPKSPAYQAVLEERIAARIDLGNDGELTVKNPDGSPAYRKTLDDLVAEVVAEYPDLVAQTRTGHGSAPAKPLASGNGRTSAAPSRQDLIDAIARTRQ